MGRGGGKGPWIKLLCQDKEGLGVVAEVFNIEDGFWEGKIVFLQIAVEPCARSPEVRDTLKFEK